MARPLPRDDADLGAIAPGGGEVGTAPWPAVVRRRMSARMASSDRARWWLLATVLLGLLSVNVSYTVFAVALPRVARELGTTENAMTWVITGPLLAYGVVAPTVGKAGDIWGHRRVYLIGLGGAAIAAGLSALAWSAPSLIAFRTLGGVEGAATGAASMALIFRAFDREDRVKAMGWWSLVGAGGPVLGVAIGGPVIEAFGWRVIFAAQVPVTIVALLIAAAVLPETERAEKVRLDWAGAATLTVGVVAFLFALNRGPELGWSSSWVIAGFVVAPLALAAFVAIELRVEEPLLPLDYLRRRNFAAPIGAQVFSNFAYMGGFILAPSLLFALFGYGERRIGLMVAARPLTFSIVAPVAGYLAVRAGERRVAVAGTLAVVASMAVFAAVGRSSSDAVVLGALALSGAGLGLATPSIAASVANVVDEANLGIASAAQQLMTQIGLVAGIQIMKTVQTSGASDGIERSFQNAYLMGGAVALLGVACAALLRSTDRSPARVTP